MLIERWSYKLNVLKINGDDGDRRYLLTEEMRNETTADPPAGQITIIMIILLKNLFIKKWINSLGFIARDMLCEE